MITVPRGLVLFLAGLFSAYHVVLGIYSIDLPRTPGPTIIALALYALATVLSLWPSSPMRMGLALAFFNVAVCVVIPLLVGSQLDGSARNGYATWYVAAVGTLMTITATRRRTALAWVGVGALVVHTIIWAGPAQLLDMGVIGSVVWVTVAVLLARALAKAGRDARQYALAERRRRSGRPPRKRTCSNARCASRRRCASRPPCCAASSTSAASSTRRTARSAATSKPPCGTRSAAASCSTTPCASR
ncbi:hypothetical protein [Cryobacterium sp. 10C3]|uniref:hypothetical protein n=1 Tax=Cryobacterium sp. 10C3 TaxID=3048577 RepID=UPI002AB4B1A4|nr:hypothetical protein [Cryobacterium sp. 10C3]MDY7557553.1 hypothetical protein [Cryobacterium sp. 10C3]